MFLTLLKRECHLFGMGAESVHDGLYYGYKLQRRLTNLIQRDSERIPFMPERNDKTDEWSLLAEIVRSFLESRMSKSVIGWKLSFCLTVPTLRSQTRRTPSLFTSEIGLFQRKSGLDRVLHDVIYGKKNDTHAP